MKKTFSNKMPASFAGIFILVFLQSFGQDKADPLFSNQAPLDIGLNISIRQIRNSAGDTAWFGDKLYFRTDAGVSDSVRVDLKGRGHFRLTNCYYPPMWIKIDKKAAKGTEFEGNKKLKLVMPCDNQRRSNALVVREFLCYKLFEMMSPYSFSTRLVNVDLTELRDKKTRNFKLKGILLEDFDKLAKRLDAKAVKDSSIAPWDLEDTSAMRFYLFELLIANTDWSTSAQHNARVIQIRKGNYIPLPYDFDMSGMVDAPYSFVADAGDEKLPIDNVKQRFYRGHCRPAGVTQFVRNEFLAKEKKLLSIADQLKGEVDDKEIRDIKKFLDEFFDILRSDFLFRTKILELCRSMN